MKGNKRRQVAIVAVVAVIIAGAAATVAVVRWLHAGSSTVSEVDPGLSAAVVDAPTGWKPTVKQLPNEPTITPQVVAEHGLSPDEYQRVLAIMGRTPKTVGSSVRIRSCSLLRGSGPSMLSAWMA